MMKQTFLNILFTVIYLTAAGQIPKKFTVSGYVKEAGSGESLIGVNIYIPALQTGTSTNNFGFYSVTLPANDSVKMVVSYVGFASETVNLVLQNDIEMNIDLKQSILLNEVLITADKVERQSESAKMSTVKLQVAQIKNVPSLLGEKDVLKVIQLMPGVQKGTEGTSGIYVRGGGPDQNLIILDDAIVYNASHLFGFFSLFNGDALKSVELTKGGFPARYGGRLSSVVEMNMKEGNKEEWHGEGGIGLISSRFTLEGPLKKNKSSILL
jgi:outer membrane receptor protein involved in Fe transport